MARGRNASLLAAGVLVVHELRYLVGYGAQAQKVSAAQGHAYLSLLTVAVAAGLVLASLRLCAEIVRARRGGVDPSAGPGLLRLWASSTAVLALIYVLQESLEGVIDSGHPVGVEGIVGRGGWWAFLLAVAVGLVIALLTRGASAAISLAARRYAAPRRRPSRLLLPGSARFRAVATPLARHLGGRAPPQASSV